MGEQGWTVFSECSCEKEKESQQITRYLESHAARKPEETKRGRGWRIEQPQRRKNFSYLRASLFPQATAYGYQSEAERRDGTPRGERRRMRESAVHTVWNFNATFQDLFPPRWPIPFFLRRELLLSTANPAHLDTRGNQLSFFFFAEKSSRVFPRWCCVWNRWKTSRRLRQINWILVAAMANGIPTECFRRLIETHCFI